jgi:hypothetical protein
MGEKRKRRGADSVASRERGKRKARKRRVATWERERERSKREGERE